jgi:hypothetical protein
VQARDILPRDLAGVHPAKGGLDDALKATPIPCGSRSLALCFGMLGKERFDHVSKRQGAPLIGLIRRRIRPMCHGA